MKMIPETSCVSQLQTHREKTPLFLPTMLIITIKLLVTMWKFLLCHVMQCKEKCHARVSACLHSLETKVLRVKLS